MIDINKLHLIAEIGINHNGDIKITKELISNAKKAGFHSVKFQKRTVEKVYSKEILDGFRESPWGKTQREQKNGLEFGKEEYDEIDQYCKEIDIHWFASAWDSESLSFLDNYKLRFNKVASAMVVDKNLLKEIAERKIYTFISTGMCTVEQIDTAVDIFKKENCEFELMHCVSTYPAKAKDLNLLTIRSLQERYKTKVGYSGHENGTVISAAAIIYGITSLERHITLDRTMYGSDQAASIEYHGMKNLSDSITKVMDAIGEEKLGFINEEEMKVAEKLRSHIKV
jgi:N-acetylneuraminate synthase